MLSPPRQPHGFLHDLLVECGIIVGISALVGFFVPFPYAFPIAITSLVLIALYRRKRTMRLLGLSVTNNDRHFGLDVTLHYILLVFALFGIEFLLPFPVYTPANSAIIALFVWRFRKKFSVVRLSQDSAM